METIRFIGAYEKIDMLLNIAKILTVMGNRVIIVDSTINQKARYIVPAINPTVSYITSFEDIDVAIGFNTIENMKDYIGITGEMPYEYMLVDCDDYKRIEETGLENITKNYFVTAFDMYSLKRGIEILQGLKQTIQLTKILYAGEVLKEDDDYLNFLSMTADVMWNGERIYFPIENGDLLVLAENQRLQKIKFKKLSVQYKDSIAKIVQQILEQKDDSNIRKVIKTLEKGV